MTHLTQPQRRSQRLTEDADLIMVSFLTKGQRLELYRTEACRYGLSSSYGIALVGPDGWWRQMSPSIDTLDEAVQHIRRLSSQAWAIAVFRETGRLPWTKGPRIAATRPPRRPGVRLPGELSHSPGIWQ